MKPRLILLLLPLSLWLWGALAFAGVEQISEKEFRDLAAELAPKVNLFAAGWENDPQAEYYGGTTRDYLYWLKGQFVEAHNASEAQAVIAKLKEQPMIDVRDFIIGDSDVDIISKSATSLDAKQFGVRKIDSQSPDILDATTDAGKNEILQGYIPAEKIRLAKDGFHATSLGDGVHEIYEGKLSVHFASAEDFAKSKYAREGINHPVLLAVRYLRLQAINYYRSHGKGFPDHALLHAGMDESSAKAVKEVIEKAGQTGELAPYLEHDKFKSWINGGIQKSFRSYTNPTAALELMKEFGVTQLPAHYPDQIETLNQYVFTKFRNQAAIETAFKNSGTTQERLYTPLAHYFPDGRLYHGTKTEPAFRGILFQGVLPSENGMGGPGLYGVAVGNKAFSEKWGGDKDRLLSFALDPQTKLIDITQGEGERLWNSFHHFKGNKEDAFAEHYGADILRYPYDTEAFVVKNGGVLHDGKGVYRTVMGLNALIEEAKKTRTVKEMLQLLSVNQVSDIEQGAIWKASPFQLKDVIQYADKSYGDGVSSELFSALSLPNWRGSEELHALAQRWIEEDNPAAEEAIIKVMTKEKHPSASRLAFLDKIFANKLGVKARSPLATYLIDFSPPLSVEKSLREWEQYAALPAETRTGRFVAQDVMKMLRDAPLSIEQQERAYTLLQGIAGKVPWGETQNLMHALVKNNFHVEELKQMAIRQFRENMREVAELDYARGLEVEQWSEFLHKRFQQDPDVKDVLFDYYTSYFKKFGGRSEPTMGQVVPMVIDQKARIKAKLIPLLESAGDEETKKKLVNALSKMELDDHEFTRVFSQTSSFRNHGYTNNLLKEHISKIGPEGAKAVLKAFVTGPSKDPFVIAVDALATFPDKGLLQKELLAQISTASSLKPGLLNPVETADRFNFPVELLRKGAVPPTPEIQEHLLSYIERNMTEQNKSLYHAVKFFDTLDLSNPTVAHRVMKLLADKRVSFGLDAKGELSRLIKSMPKDCPTAYGFLVAD